MINSFYKAFNITSPVAGIIISIALMLITGFAMTRITKRLRLPNVTAYILSGVLLGPYVLNLVPENKVEGMDFLNDIALAFIAFSTGEFFRFSTLKKNGAKVVTITDSAAAPVCRNADLSFFVSANSPTFGSSIIGPLFLTHVLASALAITLESDAKRHLEEQAEFLHDERIFHPIFGLRY